MSVTKSEIFKKLDEQRRRQKITVDVLARQAGLSRQQYYRMLSGERRVYLEAVEEMATYLGLSPTLSL